MCTTNYDQMMYSSWDMVCNGSNYFSFWAIFCPFIPLTAWKIKIKKKLRKYLEISSFYIGTTNFDQMMYGSWDMVRDRCNYFLFWAIFCPFISLTAREMKIKKKKKTPGDIIILHMYTKNYDQMMQGSWVILSDRCNYFSF